MILVVRRPAEGAAKVDRLAESYLDDLGETLSADLAKRGYRPKLWKDVRLNIARRRLCGDEHVEHLMTNYVERSDWRHPEDERYELPLIMLRSEARYLIGFRILELTTKQHVLRFLPEDDPNRTITAYHLTIRGDIYDLLNGTALGVYSESGRAAIVAGRTAVETRQQLVLNKARKIALRVAKALRDVIARKSQLRGRRFQFTFEGYDEREQSQIETLLAGIIAEDIDPENIGTRMTVEVALSRDPIPIRDELARSLKTVGLPVARVRRHGTKLEFCKE
ncbi:hypothetical protein ACFL59_11765 [Planctomycetota bacterium]